MKLIAALGILVSLSLTGCPSVDEGPAPPPPVEPSPREEETAAAPSRREPLDPLTLRLRLESTTVPAGGKVDSLLGIRNDSGTPVTDPGCRLAGGRFALVPRGDPDGELWEQIVVDCSGPFTMGSGFIATHSGPTFQARTKYGDPLPPGDYIATWDIDGRSEHLRRPVEVID